MSEWDASLHKQTWLKYTIVLMLVLGLCFRLVNLDRKVYWTDETYTSLRISGYTQAEFVAEVFTGKVVSVADLQRYQRLSAEKGWGDAFHAFKGNAEHSPLYFILARFWVQAFGSSIAAVRSLSVLLSLLTFPCLYWLCRELFNQPAVAGVAMAIVAVSPLHVLYAQEARPYTLWTVATLLSCAALLRAMRSPRGWGIYAATIALGLYVHLLFGLVAIAHALYVAIVEKFRLTPVSLSYFKSATAGLLAFLPWLTIALLNLERIQQTTASLNLRHSVDSVFDRWFRNLNLVFVNQDLGSANLILVLLSIAALSFLCRTMPRRVWLFVLLLVAVTSLPLAFADLIWGGQRSLRLRYLIPCYVGLQIAIAYLLTRLTIYLRGWQGRLGRIALTTLLLAGVLGCLLSAYAEVWWNKSVSRTSYFPAVARLINQVDRPLVISDGEPIDILSFSYELKPNVRLQLTTEPQKLRLAKGFEHIYLLNPSNPLRNRLTRQWGYRAIRAYTDGRVPRLWRLEPQTSSSNHEG